MQQDNGVVELRRTVPREVYVAARRPKQDTLLTVFSPENGLSRALVHAEDWSHLPAGLAGPCSSAGGEGRREDSQLLLWLSLQKVPGDTAPILLLV